MADTTARQYMVGFLLLTVLLSACLFLIAPAATNSTDLVHFNNTYNRLNSTQQNLDSIAGKAQPNPDDDYGILGVVNGLIEKTIGVFKFVWDSFAIFNDVLTDLEDGALPFKLPSWFTLLIYGLLVIIISFAVMSAWFKWRI